MSCDIMSYAHFPTPTVSMPLGNVHRDGRIMRNPKKRRSLKGKPKERYAKTESASKPTAVAAAEPTKEIPSEDVVESTPSKCQPLAMDDTIELPPLRRKSSKKAPEIDSPSRENVQNHIKEQRWKEETVTTTSKKESQESVYDKLFEGTEELLPVLSAITHSTSSALLRSRPGSVKVPGTKSSYRDWRDARTVSVPGLAHDASHEESQRTRPPTRKFKLTSSFKLKSAEKLSDRPRSESFRTSPSDAAPMYRGKGWRQSGTYVQSDDHIYQDGDHLQEAPEALQPPIPAQPAVPAQCAAADTLITYEEDATPCRVSLVGPTGVGKSALARLFMASDADTLESLRAGCSKEKKVSVELGGTTTLLTLHETQNLQDTFSSAAILIVFSTASRTSYEHAVDSLYTIRQKRRLDTPMFLVGNKSDLVRSRKVDYAEASQAARRFDCKFVETSVALVHHVDELLAGIVSQIRLHRRKKLASRKGSEVTCGQAALDMLGRVFKTPKKERKSGHRSQTTADLYRS